MSRIIISLWLCFNCKSFINNFLVQPVHCLSSPHVLSEHVELVFMQAQTAELRRSIEAIHEISAALETQRKKQEEDNESAAAQTEPTVTMVELRQELKSLASSLQE